MRPPTAEEAATIVALRGPADCVIAAVANALEFSYDRTAALLGYASGPDASALPQPSDGIAALEMVRALLRVNIAGSWIFSAAEPALTLKSAMQFAMLPDEMREALRGRRAVLFTRREIESVLDCDHAVAWRGERAIDYDMLAPRICELDELKVHSAVVFGIVPPRIAGPAAPRAAANSPRVPPLANDAPVRAARQLEIA